MSPTLREIAALVASAPQAAKRSLSPAASPPAGSKQSARLSPPYATLQLPAKSAAVTPEQETEQAKMDAFVFFTMMR